MKTMLALILNPMISMTVAPPCAISLHYPFLSLFGGGMLGENSLTQSNKYLIELHM